MHIVRSQTQQSSFELNIQSSFLPRRVPSLQNMGCLSLSRADLLSGGFWNRAAGTQHTYVVGGNWDSLILLGASLTKINSAEAVRP